MRVQSLALLVAPLVLPALAAAQQFQQLAGAIPGPARWSEGVECADVDGDGDLDLLFADGEGFSSAGTKRQNVLVINKLVEQGALVFADESVARLGAHLSNAKGVTTGDVNGDGWVDLLFVNAFQTDPPFLYVNQGAANPGFFTLESASRGLTTAYSSASAQLGDLDDDGDLDLLLCDSGASFLAGTGGKPHLFFNDGTGHFTEDAAALSAPTKKAQMDVQLVDVDGDWDLDFLGVCRASNTGGNHYLLLNDGAGQFSDASALVPSGSTNTYEAEVGDLDGDEDLDVFFVSLSGLQEGVARNELAPSGTLGFGALAPLPGTVDDNEIVLLDHDVDGDLDAFVGSLGSGEALWRNAGGLSFANASASIQAVADPTLDMTAADLDNDGDHDLVTAQGEGDPAQWQNKVYRNSGPPDSRAPVITALRAPASADAAGPVVVHAKARDQVLDDGQDWIVGRARYVVLLAPQAAAVLVDGSGFTPSALSVPAGTTVTWTHGGGGPQSVTSTTAPWDYDSGPFSSGAFAHTFVAPGVYAYTSTPSGATGTLTVTGAATTVAGFAMGGGIRRFALPDTAGGAGVELAFELELEDRAGNVRVSDAGRVALCSRTNVCVGAPNSTGSGASMSSTGSTGVAANDLVLVTSGLPASAIGIYFVGASPTQVPFGNGFQCVDAPVTRLGPAIASAGVAQRAFDGTLLPPPIRPQAGDVRYFQFWYRNPAGGGAGFNLSDALRVLFCP
jgi:hypothetical protein